MQLAEYFDFLTPLDIRIKGHRIGIDDVLRYHFQGRTPDEIAERLPTLSMEQIRATLADYEEHKAAMDDYMRKLEAQRKQRQAEAEANPPRLYGVYAQCYRRSTTEISAQPREQRQLCLGVA